MAHQAYLASFFVARAQLDPQLGPQLGPPATPPAWRAHEVEKLRTRARRRTCETLPRIFGTRNRDVPNIRGQKITSASSSKRGRSFSTSRARHVGGLGCERGRRAESRTEDDMAGKNEDRMARTAWHKAATQKRDALETRRRGAQGGACRPGCRTDGAA